MTMNKNIEILEDETALEMEAKIEYNWVMGDDGSPGIKVRGAAQG
jgi:hypothetical protein